MKKEDMIRAIAEMLEKMFYEDVEILYKLVKRVADKKGTK